MDPDWPLLRQTPGSKGIWGNCQFFLNQDIDDCDFWVIYEGLFKPEKARCPKANIILITAEPPSVKNYHTKYLEQFGCVLTCHRNLPHPNIVLTQQALPWMVGGKFLKESKTWEKEFTKNYDELIAINEYKKDKLLSIILSKKTFTEGHAVRMHFVEKLKESFGDDLDVFGVGMREISDKWDGISTYQYHLALENSSIPDYWTEKISDAYLAGAYPFYYGCENIGQYFPSDSFTVIDIKNVEYSIETVKKTIEQRKYIKSLDNLRVAKELILNRYNLFAVIRDYCTNNKITSEIKDQVIFPERSFTNKLLCFYSKLFKK